MKKSLITMIALLAAVASISKADILNPSADTYVNGGSPDEKNGNKEFYRVRSLGSPVRNASAYIRFDLTPYSEVESGASFSLTATSGSKSWGATGVEVYGLPDTAGLTEQDWSESTLTYNTTGSEWDKPILEDVDPFNDNLTFLGYMPSGVSGDTVTLSSTLLDSFLQSREGASATLIVVNGWNTDRQLEFHSSEATANTPTLTVIPEPATLGLIASFSVSILFIRRRFMI